VAIFNETFQQIRSELNPHAPLKEIQVLDAYKDKLEDNPTAHRNLITHLRLLRTINKVVLLNDCIEYITELNNALFQRTSLEVIKTTSELSIVYAHPDRVSTSQGHPHPSSLQAGSNQFAHIQCYNCKAMGHFTRSCLLPPQ